MSLPLSELVATSTAVRATASRLEKRALMAALFTRLESQDLALAVSFLSGEIPQGRLGVGWKAVGAALDAAAASAPADNDNPNLSLALDAEDRAATPATLADVDRAFRALAGTSGSGSTRRATTILTDLFRRTDSAGCEFLTAL